jgi:uncharacterized protein YdeI (YjbR/CyaY-like superfamily)
MPVLPFVSKTEWRKWLDGNHASSAGIWIHFARKASGIASVTYADALDVALCYGWIDSQKKRHDEKTFLQKFTPRGVRSIWSAINCAKATALVDSGDMMPAGLAEMQRARKDGRWDAAYEPQARMQVPEDLRAALDANQRAAKFFATLTSQNRYAVLFRIHAAKRPETRGKRISDFVAMLARHETFH